MNAAPSNEKDVDFWESVAVPLRKDSSFDMEPFEAAQKPVQKTRAEIYKDGIDQSPMLSVAEIREKFSKGGAIFPKQVFTGKPSKGKNQEQEPIDQPQPIDEPVHVRLQVSESSGTMSEERPEETAEAAAAAPGKEDVSQPQSPSILGADKKKGDLSSEEFTELSKLHNCTDALVRFSSPTPLIVGIKPENNRLLMKKMHLQFNAQQRLLVMLRKGDQRYIRLHDVTHADARDSVLDFVRAELPDDINVKFAVGLFFSTTKSPMVLILDSEQEKNDLFRLIIFLRHLISTDKEFKISV